MQKLPLPPYSSRRSPGDPRVTSCAHASMCWHIPALGCEKFASTCLYCSSRPATASRSTTKSRSRLVFFPRLRPITIGRWSGWTPGALASFPRRASAAASHSPFSTLWYTIVTMHCPLRVVW